LNRSFSLQKSPLSRRVSFALKKIETIIYGKYLLNRYALNGIEAPIEKTIRKEAELKLITAVLFMQIARGNNTVNSIAKAIGESSNFVRIELYKLAAKGSFTIDKSNKPYKFQLPYTPD
jgi:hypothetical protein